MSKLKNKLRAIQLPLLFSVFIFITLLISMMITFLIYLVLYKSGLIELGERKDPFLVLSAVCIITGTVFSIIFSRVPLAPLREIITATDRLAEGDFSARINLKIQISEFQKLNHSFNHMAQELESIELLRSDFVNNFSHEFKTPIVSIRGFAKMLKYEDLTREEREEYLDIIINESERLTELATNVLHLSRVENQTIIASKTSFNVSEQIRRIIVLLESRWVAKNIEITFDCDEIYLSGNEELLSQVWINLLDNAIKFSPDNSTIEIGMKKRQDIVTIYFQDQGRGMSEEEKVHIFDKFYQGDLSHATKGNGLGLTLAKRILELHEGSIKVAQTSSAGSTFEITLPVR